MPLEAAGAMISAGMQKSWKAYIGHTYEKSGMGRRSVYQDKDEVSLIESQFSRTTIDDTIVKMADIAIANYGDWTFLTEFSFTNFTYKQTKNVKTVNESTSIEKGHLNKTLSFVYGSIDTCDNVLYYAIPAIVVDGSNDVLYPATAFTHKDEEVFNAVSSYMKNEHKTGQKDFEDVTTDALEPVHENHENDNDDWTKVDESKEKEDESESEKYDDIASGP
ncbi:hypothetical protein RFI_37204 [Reticulomyxa filosa]|uniref:Uncharacterized protein n=1 Tax=Reticulomyxa filosa TaxID=46433 RepID=X6LGJ3_RETFI|nr:hypothetical protein RFI_37204 [Reticulomyxa filosa]|eukprot:ETO00247.1 hypothetical protein RFI_37204 [Reticulomyxa filosa]